MRRRRWQIDYHKAVEEKESWMKLCLWPFLRSGMNGFLEK